MDRCVTRDACLFQVFRQWKVVQNRAEGKKSERKELGERSVSSPSLPASNAFVIYFLLLFFVPFPLSGVLE